MSNIPSKQAAQMIWDELMDVRPQGLTSADLAARTGLDYSDISRGMRKVNAVLQVHYGIPRAWDYRARWYTLPLSLDEGRGPLTSELKGLVSRTTTLEKRLTAYMTQAVANGDVNEVAEVQDLLTRMSSSRRDLKSTFRRASRVLSGNGST